MKFNDWVKMQRGRALAVARLLGVTQPQVSDWVSGKKEIPAQHCKSIEAFSEGEVTCADMRPYDWCKYWPELATAQFHQPQAATEAVAHGVATHSPTRHSQPALARLACGVSLATVDAPVAAGCSVCQAGMAGGLSDAHGATVRHARAVVCSNL